ncbi:MAG: STAS domain-containing protein [Atopobiaceae bacterium]|nr:STAS domain-containing protein [Atopobiaceae bacterium]
MNITTTQNGAEATLALEGKLSVATSPDLEAAINNLPESTTNFVIDLAKLDYISSAGLRVLVSTEKLATRRGGAMRLVHPNDEVTEVFEMTGLSDVFTIEA